MSNDQAPLATGSSDLVKYLLVELHVLREHHVLFQEEMKNLVEVMFDYKRWELIFASYPITGKLNRFVHIWKIPDESTVVEVMRAGALGTKEQPDPNAAKSLEQEFRDCYQLVQSMIVETKHELVTSLPYDPNHVGYQTQTILVDTEGEFFVIDHRDLRKECESHDIADDLEQVRKRRVKVRPRGNPNERKRPHWETSSLPKRAAEGDSSYAARRARLEAIQGHLNRGSTLAVIKSQGSRQLLFNLAGLKARSVYQKIDTAGLVAKAPRLHRAFPGGDGDVDVSSQLLIATPWGAVYELGANELGTVAKPIPAEARASVQAALQPILDGETPLAAIPEERDDVIGDGCACFVINLSSFLGAGAAQVGGEAPAESAQKKQNTAKK